MYSRCPHCQTQQPLTVEQLRQRRGLLACAACGESFDALQFLTDQLGPATTGATEEPIFRSLGNQPQTPAVWLAASLVMLLVLAGQIIYFEGYRLSMFPKLRAGLETTCAIIGCRLPSYRNLDELTVSHSELLNRADRSYLFSAALSNQGLFPQVVPDLKLTLLGFNGQALAERVFVAGEYLDGPIVLAAEQTTEIRISIAAPLAKVGGYTFTLI